MFLMFKFSYCSLLFFSEKQIQTQNKKNGMYFSKQLLIHSYVFLFLVRFHM